MDIYSSDSMVRHHRESCRAFAFARDSQCSLSEDGVGSGVLGVSRGKPGDALNGVRALGHARGLSVTIPHKVAAIPFLDEVEPTAKHIGAINTVVVEDGKLKGYNTDASGALRALERRRGLA